MSYNASDLATVDTSNAAWGLAWLRFILRDTNDDAEVFSDIELEAVLNGHAQSITGTDGATSTRYRPHAAAAALIESDPDRALSESLMSYSRQNREPAGIARGILASYRWMDDEIHDATGVYPDRGRQLRPWF